MLCFTLSDSLTQKLMTLKIDIQISIRKKNKKVQPKRNPSLFMDSFTQNRNKLIPPHTDFSSFWNRQNFWYSEVKRSFILKLFTLQGNQKGLLNGQDIKSISMIVLTGFENVKTGFSSQHTMLKRKLVSAQKPMLLLLLVSTAFLSYNSRITAIISVILPGYYWHNQFFFNVQNEFENEYLLLGSICGQR